MKKAVFKFFVWFISAFALAVGARGGALTNNFDVSRDYVANGIVGDTNWDGVYLSFGDIPNGNAGGSGSGRTIFADANNTFGGYFSVRTTAGDWAGAGDDGFFLYKVVSGDFDVSVQSAPTWQTPANHFAGLLVRAYQTNNSGAPFGISNTNAVENWIALMRGQEFNIFEMRRATNGGDAERTFTDIGADTNSLGNGTNATRYWRIVRSQDTNFMFFWKTNAVDNWVQLTNSTDFPQGVYKRPDLAGVKMQVGINQALFSGNQATAFFTDFELSGPNVNPVDFSTLGTPSDIVTTATNIGGSLTFSWTVGTPGDSSLVIMRSRGNIQVSPSQGLTYTANSAFGTANTLIGAGEYVVFNGAGNSVTVTNLGANNISYAIAVYEYTNTGSAIIYNTAAPATNSFAGPGEITGASLSVAQNDIPVPGAVLVRMIASFSTGETSDQSVNTSWLSSDGSVATVDSAGAVSAVTNGVTTITGTFGPFTLNTNITVHSPVLLDSFSNVQDYITSGLLGSMYDGVFQNFGDVPGAVAGADGNGATTTFNSQIFTTDGLRISSNQSDWQGTANDGPFLFKIVPGSRNGLSGDFQAMVEVTNMNTLANASVGLMARLFNATTAGAAPAGAENHVNYWKVQNGTTAIRRTQAGANTTFVANGPVGANRFLLLQRVQSTNFYFYEKATSAAAWTFITNIVLTTATNNAPMEVGIAEETRSGVTADATLHAFMLDAAGVVSGTPPPPAATNFSMTLNPNLSMTLNWVAADSLGNPVQSVVVMRAGSPVTAQPTLGQPLSASSVFGTAASGLGSGNFVVFVSAASPASTNNTVTVTGLIPGVTYYAAVYTFTGSGNGTVFNNVVPLTGASANLADGFLIGLRASLAGGIPVGGIGQLLVEAIYTGGVPVDKSSVAVISSGDTNIIKILAGVLTGISSGTAPITNSFGGFTNVTPVTVRAPFFTDVFTTSHDYLASGVAGTGWDDMYNPNDITGNPIPGSTYVPPAGSGATIADANVSSNGNLTITSAGDGWENGLAGGFFLFKYVPGDFQMSVHINTNDYLTSLGVIGNAGGPYAFNQPGIMARGYSVTNGLIGAPLGYVQTNAAGAFTAGEYWVDLTRFDEFLIGTYARRNIDSAVSQNTQTDSADLNYWLLISRTQGTNFILYKRLNPTDPWKRLPNNTSYQLFQFAGRPMQVGLAAGPFNGAQRTVHFDNFMLDTTSGSPLTVSLSGGIVTLTWPPIPATVQHTFSLNPPDWQPVSGTPILNNNGYSLTIPASQAGDFFRLKQ